MRIIRLDGSPAAVDTLTAALADALDGGPAVLPLAAGATVPAAVTGDDDGAGHDHAGDSEPPEPGTAGRDHAGGAGPPGSGSAGPPPGSVLVATSGSTAEPRLVVLPAAALRASADATADRLGGPARWLLALPADHVAGVQVIVRALRAGAPPVVMDLREGFRPAGFATATAALGPGRRVTSLVPTQLLRLLDAGGAALDALCGYAAVLVGGAALDAGLHRRAEAAGVRVVTTYGMTETAGGCVYDGVPLTGVRVRLEPDGRIVLGGPTLAAGYLGRPAETAVAFDTDERGGRTFRTGDLGRWSDGRLEVAGRADDMIVTGGEKVAPGAVERVLAAQPGVRAACVVGLPDAEWGAVVAAALVLDTSAGPATAGAEEWGAAVRAAVRAELGRAAVPRVLRAVDTLPLRGIGKPDRAAVARLLER